MPEEPERLDRYQLDPPFEEENVMSKKLSTGMKIYALVLVSVTIALFYLILS